ncbi:MAG TPA: ATP-binding cassette domain-containing protein [Thermodesulfobacteriota bacterium]|nr:ATP-binding cassette domain-containing protein [Thermodesulfobacteriota bacterium]
MEELVRVSDLKYTYPDGTFLHFRGLEFVVHRGERVVILGPNGSGKSTLLFHLLGLFKPSKGDITVFGFNPYRDYIRIRERIGVLLQNVEEQIIAPTVRDDISFSPRNYGYKREEIERLVEDIVEKLDIKHLMNKVPHYLSGGEKTKVGLGGALVTRPELLILDEPFEGLDPTCRMDLINLLNRTNRENKTAIILSTHNIDTVPLIADTVYLMATGGEIVAKGTPKEVFTRVELLARCHIEPPVLGSLFLELRKYGIDLDMSLTIEEAARIIAEEISSFRKKSSLG